MIPAKIQKKADGLLNKYMSGETRLARKGTNINYLAIEVGYHYRLICWTPDDRFNRRAWDLITHETYNKVTRKPKK